MPHTEEGRQKSLASKKAKVANWYDLYSGKIIPTHDAGGYYSKENIERQLCFAVQNYLRYSEGHSPDLRNDPESEKERLKQYHEAIAFIQSKKGLVKLLEAKMPEMVGLLNNKSAKKHTHNFLRTLGCLI